MAGHLFYGLDLLLLCTCFLYFPMKAPEQRVTLSMIQILVGLPLLFCYYFFLAQRIDSLSNFPALFSVESIFSVLWLGLAYQLSRAFVTTEQEPRYFAMLQLLAGIAVGAPSIYYMNHKSTFQVLDDVLITSSYGPTYFYALILLLAMLASAWRLEVFWGTLSPSRRREYKFMVVGGYIVCAALGWAASYRITYRRLVSDHFILLTLLIFMAWAFICYAVARHRLLNRKIFISRKIVNSFVAPSLFSAYLFSLGLVSLLIRTYRISLPDILIWLALAVGLIAIALFFCSDRLRRRIHFFISTHFYINKYEYRDQWLTLSSRLQGAKTETDVVRALYEVLTESFYATRCQIWVGGMHRDYKSIPPPIAADKACIPDIPQDDPLVFYLESHPHFYLEENGTDLLHQKIAACQADFFKNNNLVLMAPLLIGDKLVGVIGLGPEFTGGRYGHDDFDLLAALGTQTASALVAVRMAEELADIRERQAWDRLSAFVLHDVKNAATMLSLVRANAFENIQNPEFQKDMLEAVDDALARMDKVQKCLKMLKEESIPEWSDVELHRFLEESSTALSKRLKDMTITVNCPAGIHVCADIQLLTRMLENILLNAFEAGGEPPFANIEVEMWNSRPHVSISITDNGPGVNEDLLPETLFQPLKTTKPNGSGIGLWQVKQFAHLLNGEIHAMNTADKGARFTISLPAKKS